MVGCAFVVCLNISQCAYILTKARVDLSRAALPLQNKKTRITVVCWFHKTSYIRIRIRNKTDSDKQDP
jgi:hypothetical protein